VDRLPMFKGLDRSSPTLLVATPNKKNKRKNEDRRKEKSQK